MTAKLTILLTLKDRAAFTQRWMRYMNDVRCPYPILIADGGSDAAIEAYLRDHANYPRLTYEYVRFPFDETLEVFFHKLASAARLVTTPYVLFADNDDFFLLDKIPEMLSFLDAHDDFVSCGGQWARLSLWADGDDAVNAPTGEHYTALVTRSSHSVDADVAVDRLCSFINRAESLWMNWYGIHRTAEVAAAFEIVARVQPREIVAFEIFTHLFLLSRGKYKGLDTLFYIRQAGSSQTTAQVNHTFNLVERFILNDTLSELNKLLQETDGVITEAGRERVTRALSGWFAGQSILIYGNRGAVHGVKQRTRRALRKNFRLFYLGLRAAHALRDWRRSSKTTFIRLPIIERYVLGSSSAVAGETQ